MRRLYYLAGDIDTTRAISERLHMEGISDWNFHVLARDPSGLYSTTFIQRFRITTKI